MSVFEQEFATGNQPKTVIKCQRALFEWNVYIVMTLWYSVVNTGLSFCSDFDIDGFFSRLNCEKLKANN